MLYNKNWDKKSEPDLSLEALIAWLETRNPNEFFDPTNGINCMVGQWISSTYVIDEVTGGWTYVINGNEYNLKTKFESVVFGDGSELLRGYSFGEVLNRAKKMLSKQKEKVDA